MAAPSHRTGLVLPTTPARAYQRRFWGYMEGGGDRAALCWHRRSGKDNEAAKWSCVTALETQPAVYWHMLPEYAQARKAIWTAVNPHTGMRRIDEWFPPQIRKRTREQEMEIELVNGALWQVIGSDSFDRLVGASVKGLVLSEYALANPLAWTYIRPILRENAGWAIFPSTPRGKNHWHKLYTAAEADPTWFAETLPATETGVFTAEQLALERAEMQRELGFDDGDAKYRQEYLCDWHAALVGAYYAREFVAIDTEKRLDFLPHDPGLPVYTAWDLGHHDSTAIWFAQVALGGAVRVIDFAQGSGAGLDHYAAIIKNKPYVYAEHILPHDADNSDVAIPGGKKRLDVLKQYELGGRLRALPKLPVAEGIMAARRLLPRCVFAKGKTDDGIEALRAYQKKWNAERKVFEDTPLHNWASDAADAFRYLALGLPEKLQLTKKSREERRRGPLRRSSSGGGRHWAG